MSAVGITGVMLCERVDLAGMFRPAFETLAPQVKLMTPDEISDPDTIEFALAWRPAEDAFLPYRNLKGIFSIAAGVDWIMACPSRPRHLPVVRVVDPDQAKQMAAFASFHVIWHHRQMAAYLDAQSRRSWERPFTGRSAADHTVGIMGFGHMGRQVGRALTGLGYPVRSLTRSLPDPVEPGINHFTNDQVGDFLSECKSLINLLPLTDETRGILSKELFGKLPQGASLIQLGRGAHLVDEDLIWALDTGQLSGASLDVFSTEPLPPEHPFWVHPQIFATPHTAAQADPPAVVASVVNGLARIEQGASH